MKKEYKIILDTDIGDDIDDAFALYYALRHPQIEILGVTTVYKNAYERACIAKGILEKDGRGDIGVYVGEDFPLQEPLKPFLFEKKNEYDRYDLLSWRKELSQYKIESERAVDFILRTVEENPNEVVLVGIGPMTNIAKAFLRAPNTMKKLKRIVVMSGNINAVYEWNIMCDPEAANVVFHSGMPITCVGSNCTEQCFFNQSDLLEYLSAQGDAPDFINEMMREWITYNMRPPIMHDGLALSEVPNKFVQYKKCKVEVPLQGAQRGMILCSEDENGWVDMSKDFDKEGFMNHFKEIYLYGREKKC